MEHPGGGCYIIEFETVQALVLGLLRPHHELDGCGFVSTHAHPENMQETGVLKSI